ncbi:MAG: hypothetical protein ACOY71_03325, partial [Gemmatimonadota bacterium]
MSDQPRDWDKELAEIDKLLGQQPAPGAPADKAVGPAARPSAPGSGQRALPPARAGAKEAIGTWFRVVLGVLLAGAVWIWPYPNHCGLNLYLYLGAAVLVVVTGL